MSYRPLLRYSYRIPSSSLHTPSSFASSVVYIYPLYYQRYYSSSSSSSSSLFVRTTKNGRRVQLLPTSSSSFTTQIIPRRTFVSRPSGYSYRDRLPINFGLVIVPQQKVYIIERLGKFYKVLSAGLHILIPFVDRVAYVHSLKENAIAVPNQTAITRDNVTITIDGVLYIRITDAYAASYGVADPIYALTQLAQTTMRSELGKITLDKTFEEREALNTNIVIAINQAAKAWGTECLRYEIKDIIPPTTVKTAMDSQAEAERKKRADILASEGEREAQINRAEGSRRSIVLQAQGDAEAILARAKASAQAVELLAKATRQKGGQSAMTMRIAEQYINSFSKLAKRGNTMIIPADAGNVSSMVAQALGVYDGIKNKQTATLMNDYESNANDNDSLEDFEPEPESSFTTDNSTIGGADNFASSAVSSIGTGNPSSTSSVSSGGTGANSFAPSPYPSGPPTKVY